jgi:hypothetical protein
MKVRFYYRHPLRQRQAQLAPSLSMIFALPL